MQINDSELITDGLKFKNELADQNSVLFSYRTALYFLREQCIEKAKKAHSRKNEERASYYMGMVEGVDMCIKHPELMVKKWETMVEEKMNERNESYAAQ